mgnify:CR=1 FL=1
MVGFLREFDPEIAEAIQNEIERERAGVELIASENFVSRAVLEAVGSVMTNKYSEGYPKKRYYGGNEFIDVSESLAIERAKKLFGCQHVNVQPHAGSQANMEAYFAMLSLGDTILGMDLSCGGHLTHGSSVNFSGKFYRFISYPVDPETKLIDMDAVRKLAIKERPKLILSGFSAYPRSLDFREFMEIAHEVDAYHMADIAHIAGLCATGVHQSPIEYCDVVTTTTHKTLRGPRGAMIMCKEEDRLHDKYRAESKKNMAQLIDSAVFPGMQGGPLDHVIAAKAVAFKEALQPEFKEYQKRVVSNAKVLAETLMENGIDLVTGGTENHLMMIDLTKTGLGGKAIEKALDEVHIFTNKNMIPFDKRTPFDPSGIRVGTPATTTRGMKHDEMKIIGESIAKIVHNIYDESVKARVKSDILSLTKRFPLYPELKV